MGIRERVVGELKIIFEQRMIIAIIALKKHWKTIGKFLET